MTEQNATKLNERRLSDAELAGAVSGGRGGCTSVSTISAKGIDYGQINELTHVITYRPCPRCGKPMHSEWYAARWYCDPCNFSEYHPREATWNGTEEELIAAAS